MAKAENAKVNKKKKHYDKNKIAVWVVTVLLVTYIGYECYSATHVEYEFVTAVKSQTYQTIDTSALAIRDEKIISNSDGVTVACVADGEKVKKNGNIAMKFASSEKADNYANRMEYQNRIDYYVDIESQAAGTATNIESIDSQIVDDVNDYVRKCAAKQMSTLDSSADEMNKSFTRRQLIIGKAIDFASIREGLQTKMDAINSDCEPIGYVSTEESGVFSSVTDGLESAFDYKDIDNLTLKKYQNYVAECEDTKTPKNNTGKLITSYSWYFCCEADPESLYGIKNGDAVEVAVKGTDNILNCTVYSGADRAAGADKVLLILQCADMDSSIAAYRLEDIEIRCKSFEGVKIPASALHIVNKHKGVYVLVANTVEFRPCDVLYSTKDYIIVSSYDAKTQNGIRTYDNIITEGKDLYDGKVYK